MTKHKSAIWDRTSPTCTSNLVYMCAGGFTNLQTELIFLVFFLIWVFSALGGRVGGCIWGDQL